MLIDGLWVTPEMIPRLCELSGAHRTTVARWLDRGELPRALHTLLRILDAGDLGAICDDWHGWRLNPRDGLLYSPNEPRHGYQPGNVMALQYRLHQLAALMAEGRTDDARELASVTAIDDYPGARSAG